MFANVLPNALRYLLATYFVSHTPAQSMRFQLRHVHGIASNSSRVVFSDVADHPHLAGDNMFEVPIKRMKVPRARSQDEFFRSRVMGHAQRELLWDEADMIGPEVRDQQTLQVLARMTANAYYEDRGKKGWYDIGPEWNIVRLYCVLVGRALIVKS